MAQGIIAATESYKYPQLDMKVEKLIALTMSLEKAGFAYGFGSKISPLTLQAEEVPAAHRRVDCSGFVRWAIFHACGGLTIPDGSQNQHDWFEQNKFKISDTNSCLLKDDVIRIAFLAPHDTPSGIGHVLFVVNGLTYESHGGHGPDSRKYEKHGWMSRLHVYVLRIP